MEIFTKPELLWFVGVYLLFMLGLGWYYGRGAKGTTDFIVGGRTMGSLIVFGTMLATWCGGGAIYGGGNSMSYSSGMWTGMWFALIAPVGCLVMYYLAPKIRELMGDNNIFTTAGLIRQKYGRATGTVVSIAIILAYVAIVSYALRGFGYILNVATGLPLNYGILLSMVICIILACTGGLKSVAPTDAWSILIIIVGLILAIPFSLHTLGGWSEVVANVPETHFDIFGTLGGVSLFAICLPTIMLMFGDQLQYQRIIAADSLKTYRRSNRMMILGSFLVYPPIAILATVARAAFPEIEPGMATISTSLLIPTFLGGLLIAACGAITITTADSCILSSASNFTLDIVKEFFKPDMKDKEIVTCTRIVCVVFGVLAAMMILLWPNILAVQMWAYTIYGAAVTPALLGALFWKKATKLAGICSVTVGLLLSIALELHNPFPVDLSLIAIPVATLVLIIVGLADKKGQQNMIDVKKIEIAE